jgi:hypothetical protein
MKIVLEMDGWRKVEDVAEYQVRNGTITMGVFYPMLVLVTDPEAPVKNPLAAVSVNFYSTGEKTVGGMPIFAHRK